MTTEQRVEAIEAAQQETSAELKTAINNLKALEKEFIETLSFVLDLLVTSFRK